MWCSNRSSTLAEVLRSGKERPLSSPDQSHTRHTFMIISGHRRDLQGTSSSSSSASATWPARTDDRSLKPSSTPARARRTIDRDRGSHGACLFVEPSAREFLGRSVGSSGRTSGRWKVRATARSTLLLKSWPGADGEGVEDGLQMTAAKRTGDVPRSTVPRCSIGRRRRR